MSAAASASVYTDFQGLGNLRGKAREDARAALDEVAQQFEAVFTQMMLKNMRDASPDNALFDSNAMDTFEELHDKQLANGLADSQSLGIADMIKDQIRPHLGGGASSDDEGEAGRTIQDEFERAIPVPPTAEAAGEGEPGGDEEFASARDFVRRLWPEAEAAADELDVGPEVLVAQAALETGWGQQVARGEDGRNSRNLFNIKADRSWEGDSVSIQTREFMGGRMVGMRDDFRAYDSYAESFRDYVDFLKSNPRYGEALQQGDQSGFIRGLQEAGYATDPDYADKVERVMQSEPLAAVAADEVKVS
ncbi:flagellar protein FlgJ [Thiohalospira halophila DSM 15071]|uniref:Peptidoglycan hydrolase FlgJ n=1 Tax=Thiohalospira halophila DSM 15071 TaxID=1123397 RepID=A0A1I1WBZ6_9GAMM|nr:flagellar assembly peptidoglycan hydrolase FlgJ [Thiohalospira halophila]SFD92677.1 flagellar protein FlgJ [Thiohalospira halophila DSM 15071]